MHVLPEPIQFGSFRFVEHQTDQLIIFTIVQGQRDHFVDRHDAGVAQSRGKQLSELIELCQQSGLRLTAVTDQDRNLVDHWLVAIGPCGFSTCDSDVAGQRAGTLHRRLIQYLHLDTAFEPRRLMQHRRDNELTPLHQFQWNGHLLNKRSLNTQVGLGHFSALGMTSESKCLLICSRRLRS